MDLRGTGNINWGSFNWPNLQPNNDVAAKRIQKWYRRCKTLRNERFEKPIR